MPRTYTSEEQLVPYKVYNPEAQMRNYASSEQALIDAGGKRVNARLKAKAVKAMEKLQKRHSLTQTEAIEYALVNAK